MQGAVMLRSRAEDQSEENARRRFLFFGREDKKLAPRPIRFLHESRLGLTRRQRYFPRMRWL